MIASKVLQKLYAVATNSLGKEEIHMHLNSQVMSDTHGNKQASKEDESGQFSSVQVCNKIIKAQSQTQSDFIQIISRHDIVFGVGPAGTGKTFLAVSKALEALERRDVSRIILARPAVEAGEQLGFLPGDLAQKADPYLHPIFDALYMLAGGSKVHQLMKSSRMEIDPLAYMRGRSLNNAFVLLDEAQNTTVQQMKMFLSRLGVGLGLLSPGIVRRLIFQNKI